MEETNPYLRERGIDLEAHFKRNEQIKGINIATLGKETTST